MNTELVVEIYKIIWCFIWILAMGTAIALFARTLMLSHSGDDGSELIVGKFRQSNEKFGLIPEKSEWKTIAFLVLTFLLARAVQVLVALLVKKNYFGEAISSFYGEFTRWDANHYVGLARYGYTNEGDRAFHIVFYPLFPWIVRAMSWLGIDAGTAAYIQPNLFFALSVPLMYKLLRIDFSKNVSVNAILLMIFNPFAFFFSFPFTESTFLFLSLLFFFLIRKEKWIWAGLCGILVALTKNFGLILVIPYGVWLITVCCKRHYGFKGFLIRVLPVLGIGIGFGIYLLINYLVDGNPFQFMIFQKEHWSNEISCIIKNTGNHLRYFLNEKSNINWKIYLWLGDILAMTFAMIAVFLKRKKIPFVYNIYLLAYIFLMMTVSWLLSGPRYMLASFPLYIPYAVLINDNKFLRYGVIAVEFVLGTVVLTSYIMGASIM